MHDENLAMTLGPAGARRSRKWREAPKIGAAGSSGRLLPPSPPCEKATACQDQGRQPGTRDGTGNRAHAATDTYDSVVETEPCSAQAAHRFTKRKLDSGRTSQEWDVDQVV
jgi:hypothetical protein